VSAATLAVAVIEPDQPVQQREFANRASGHKALIVWLGKRKGRVLCAWKRPASIRWIWPWR
jgi:hypothetical protein